MERDEELASIEACLTAAFGGRGNALLIQGPAGIGKTRLLAAAKELAQAAGLRVISARGGELERDFPFGIVRQLFDGVVRGQNAQRAQLLAGAARHAETVFSPDSAAGLTDASYTILHGLYWLTANLADAAPILLTVDDVHWTDTPSARFLSFFAKRMDHLPVALLVASRTDESSAVGIDELVSEPVTQVMRLKPLSPAAVEQIVSETVGSPDPRLSRAIYAATRGNPFYVHELLVEVEPFNLDQGLEAGLDAVPDRVARAVIARLNRAGAASLALAQGVAVLGEQSSREYAAALTGLDLPAAGTALQHLVRARILEDSTPLRFVHPIVRAAVYGSILPEQRAALHRRSALLLENQGAAPEDVALQLLAVPPSGDAAAVDSLRRAAQSALGRGANEAAARYLKRALDEPPSEDQRVNVILELGIAESRAVMAGALDHLEEAFQTSTDPAVLTQAAIHLGQTLLLTDRYQQGGEVVERALKRLDSGEVELTSALEGVLLMNSQTTSEMRGHVLPQLRAFANRLQGNTEEVPFHSLAVLAIENAGGRGTADAALRFAEGAWAGGLLLRLMGPEAPFASIAIAAAAHAGRSDLAERWATETMDAASTTGSLRGFSNMCATRAWIRHLRGDIAGAEADARGFFEIYPEARIPILPPLALGPLIDAIRERGEVDTAWSVMATAGIDRARLDTALDPILSESVSRLLLAEGRITEALTELSRIEAWERDWESEGVWVSWRAYAAIAHLQTGDREAADRYAHEQLQRARAYGAPRPLGIGLQAAGLIAGGEQGLELLHEAVVVLAASDARLDNARALVELGGALRRAGRRVEARTALHEGRELAVRCGATELVERAISELRASGAHLKRIPSTGVDALTPSERRVATLAAEGKTNRDISQMLFVAPKTIESHMRSVFRKLGIHSRSELSRHVQEPS